MGQSYKAIDEGHSGTVRIFDLSTALWFLSGHIPRLVQKRTLSLTSDSSLVAVYSFVFSTVCIFLFTINICIVHEFRQFLILERTALV